MRNVLQIGRVVPVEALSSFGQVGHSGVVTRTKLEDEDTEHMQIVLLKQLDISRDVMHQHVDEATGANPDPV